MPEGLILSLLLIVMALFLFLTFVLVSPATRCRDRGSRDVLCNEQGIHHKEFVESLYGVSGGSINFDTGICS